MPLTDDLAPLFADFGVEVLCGHVAVRGIFDAPTSAALGGLATLDEHQLTLPADALPGIGHGDTVTIARTEYVVREVFLLDDGALKRVTLRVV
jgi:hypothetical protein